MSACPRRSVHSAGGKVRQVWDNPILWREICTRAYGKKVLVIRLVYWVVFAICVWALVASARSQRRSRQLFPRGATQSITALLVVSLILLNAAAVTSLTTERDGGRSTCCL